MVHYSLSASSQLTPALPSLALLLSIVPARLYSHRWLPLLLQGGKAPPLGEYKLLANCQCFGGQELDAEKTFKLDAGEIFQVRRSHMAISALPRQRSSNSQSLSTHGLWSPETVWRCDHSSDPVQLSVALAIDR